MGVDFNQNKDYNLTMSKKELVNITVGHEVRDRVKKAAALSSLTMEGLVLEMANKKLEELGVLDLVNSLYKKEDKEVV